MRMKESYVEGVAAHNTAFTASATTACPPAPDAPTTSARARELLNVPKPQINPADGDTSDEPSTPAHPCPCCGGRMIIIETFARGCSPSYRPAPPTLVIRIDTS
jgi:hypothetical protein